MHPLAENTGALVRPRATEGIDVNSPAAKRLKTANLVGYQIEASA